MMGMTTETPPRGVPLPPPEQLDPTEATGTPARRSSPTGRPPIRRRTAFTRPEEAERDWRSRGTCASGLHDAELWFSPLPAERHRAMMLCYGCPVLATCRSWAEDTRQAFGIWGGLDFEASPGQTPALDPATGTPGKPAAARVPLLERVAAVLDEYPGATIDEIADRLGYKGAASLERTLYRRGDDGKALIRMLKPGSRSREQVEAEKVTFKGLSKNDPDHPWLVEAALPVNEAGTNVQHRKTGKPGRKTEDPAPSTESEEDAA
jgi:hypothetical protein